MTFPSLTNVADDRGCTLRCEAIEGDIDQFLMIETFDLKHPRCPIVLFNPSPDIETVTYSHPVPKVVFSDVHDPDDFYPMHGDDE